MHSVSLTTFFFGVLLDVVLVGGVAPIVPVPTESIDFPYAVDLLELGYEDECLGLPDLRARLDAFLACVAADFAAGFNVANGACNCQAAFTTAEGVCDPAAFLTGDFVCAFSAFSFFEPGCPTAPASLLPVGFPETELNLDFELPDLPLDQNLPVDLIAREGITYTQLFRANRRMYSLATNYQCFNKQFSFADNDLLPGWTTRELFLPQYQGAAPSDASQPLVAIAQKEKDLLIVVRGTVKFAEWLADFDYAHVEPPVGPGKIARGWGTVGGNILDLLDQRLQDIVANPGSIERVIITGHSLGGFVSTIVAQGVTERLKNSNVSVFGAHFASNRVGDLQWQEAFEGSVNSRFFQFALDPVPWFPCQTFAVCNEESKAPVPTTEGGDAPVCFAQMTGVAEFLPQFGGSYFLNSPPNNLEQAAAAHLCSYNCWLSRLFIGDSTEESAECSLSSCPFAVSLEQGEDPKRHPLVPRRSDLQAASQKEGGKEGGKGKGSLSSWLMEGGEDGFGLQAFQAMGEGLQKKWRGVGSGKDEEESRDSYSGSETQRKSVEGMLHLFDFDDFSKAALFSKSSKGNDKHAKNTCQKLTPVKPLPSTPSEGDTTTDPEERLRSRIEQTLEGSFIYQAPPLYTDECPLQLVDWPFANEAEETSEACQPPSFSVASDLSKQESIGGKKGQKKNPDGKVSAETGAEYERHPLFITLTNFMEQLQF